MKMKFIILIAVIFTTHTVIANEYNIIDFGAVRNTLSTSAIQKAIDAATTAGGGIVVVPAGKFIIGALILKSNVNLYLEQGAVLESSMDLEHFTVEKRRYGMIYCEDATNVSITGKGSINARGTDFYDTTQNHGVSSGLGGIQEFDRKYTRQKDQYMPAGTFFTDGPIQRKPRPGMSIVFFHCNQVTISGITVRDTPVWAIRFGYCEDVTVTGVSIYNNLLIPNSDGIHMTTSRNVRISDCEIVAGDDCIIVTGFDRIENTPGYSMTEQRSHKYGNKSIYSENIQVNNCHLQSRSAAIRVGYGQHPIRRCVFTNIVISESNRGIGVFARDSASIEDLIFSNIIIETRLHNGIWWGNGEPIHLSSISRFKDEPVGQIKNVQFNNIQATGEHGILLYGLKESHMDNIRFNNVRLLMKRGKETDGYGGNIDLRPANSPEKQLFASDIPAFFAQYADNLQIRDFEVKWANDLPAFFTHGIQCTDVTNLVLSDYYSTGNPNARDSKAVNLERTTKRK
jgi:polygalacturonase